MLSVPWFVPPCDINETSVEYDGCRTRVEHMMFRNLDETKHNVGTYRIEHGVENWRIAVDATDTKVEMPLILSAPINRAYYKMVEIIRTCIVPASCHSFHMCEAPGGFVQACMEEFKKTLTNVYCSSLKTHNSPHFSSVLGQQGVNIVDVGNNDITVKHIRDQYVEQLKGNVFGS